MSDFINTIDQLGDEVVFKNIVERTITEFKDDTITTIGSQYRSSPTFAYCMGLTTIDMPNITMTGSNLFTYCTSLTNVNLPKLTQVNSYVFRGCSVLTKLDLPKITIINSYAFYSCSNLSMLVLRSDTACRLIEANAFTGTPIAKGTGYIYVPLNLFHTYIAASNWSTYSKQFRVIGQLFRNQVLVSVGTDGSIYNSIGYKNSIRIRSGGTEASSANISATGYISVKGGDTLRFYLRSGGGCWTDINSVDWQSLSVFDSSFTILGQVATQNKGSATEYGIFLNESQKNKIVKVGATWTYTIPSGKDIAYVRLALPNVSANGGGADFIVTVNEEIVYE